MAVDGVITRGRAGETSGGKARDAGGRVVRALGDRRERTSGGHGGDGPAASAMQPA